MIKLILVLFVFLFISQSYEQEQKHLNSDKILEHQEIGATESQEHRRENKRKK